MAILVKEDVVRRDLREMEEAFRDRGRWVELNQSDEEIACHEAGHFVMNVLVKSVPHYITIDQFGDRRAQCGPSPRDIDGMELFNMCQAILVSYAAGAATMRFFGHEEGNGGDIDKIHSERWLSVFGEDWLFALEDLDRITHDVIWNRQVSSAIEIVKNALIEKRTLIESDLDEVVFAVYKKLGRQYVKQSAVITNGIKRVLADYTTYDEYQDGSQDYMLKYALVG